MSICESDSRMKPISCRVRRARILRNWRKLLYLRFLNHWMREDFQQF